MTIRSLVLSEPDGPKNQKVDSITIDVLNIVRDMLETMVSHNMEVITGPDIGVPLRVVAIDGTQHGMGVLVMINPAVLSGVDVGIVVEDITAIIVEFVDLTGQVQSAVLTKTLADIVRGAIQDLGDLQESKETQNGKV